MRTMESMMDSVVDFFCSCCCGYVQDPGLKYIESKYKIESRIGEGGTGIVYKCICKGTKEVMALKKMPDIKNARDEINILRALNSDGGSAGILKFRDFTWPEPGDPHKSMHVCLVTEYCNCRDLERWISPFVLPPERQIAKIIKSLVEALKFCHAKRVIHRDVKVTSIFRSYDSKYSSSTTILGNFDRAIQVKPDENLVYGNVGTVGFSAPEMRSGRGYLYEVDIWSAGVVLYFLLCAMIPFSYAETKATAYDQIYEHDTKPDVTSGKWSSVSDSAKDLVLGMLQKNILNRFSCDQILNHPWILDNTGPATSSESNKEELGSSSTTVREAASASEIVPDTGIASETLFPKPRVVTVVDSDSPSSTVVDSDSDAETGYTSMRDLTPLITAKMKGKSKA